MNWMHSCRRAAELMSQRLDEPLGLLDSLRLRMHLSMCGDCHRVSTQLAGVEALTAELFAGAAEDEEGGPPAQAHVSTTGSERHGGEEKPTG
ncbi:MAG: zf-HC2 domain-containing protein [Burkholderiales bacterium]|nr:zf-HC2 domain-containing protein [Burkholderiales bacterium]